MSDTVHTFRSCGNRTTTDRAATACQRLADTGWVGHVGAALGRVLVQEGWCAVERTGLVWRVRLTPEGLALAKAVRVSEVYLAELDERTVPPADG